MLIINDEIGAKSKDEWQNDLFACKILIKYVRACRLVRRFVICRNERNEEKGYKEENDEVNDYNSNAQRVTKWCMQY